jgi:Family of unknown function (DUF5989)
VLDRKEALVTVFGGRIQNRLGRLWLGVATTGEFSRAMVESGRWWLLPMLLVLGLAALLLALVAAIEYAAPFVYTMF